MLKWGLVCMSYLLCTKVESLAVDVEFVVDVANFVTTPCSLVDAMKIGAHPSKGFDGQDTRRGCRFQTPEATTA